MIDVPVKTDTIALAAFLKWAGIAATGGHAKQIILTGVVRVNGEEERRRSRKLAAGELVSVAGIGEFRIVRREDGPAGTVGSN